MTVTPTTPSASAPVTGRRLGYVGFAAVVLVYLAILQLGGPLAQQVFGGGDGFTTTRDVMVNMWVPLGLALVFTYVVIGYLGWWRPVLREERRTRRWVWAVPVVLAACILLAIDYAALLDKDLGFVLALLVATQMVGWGEEGMFRGVGVEVLRQHGLTEGRVALWPSLVFGSVHLSNAFGAGSDAVVQAVAVSFAGYFFYLIRRVSGGNVLNSVLHGLFDFSILSGTAILADQGDYLGTGAAFAAYAIIAVIVLVKRNRVEPAEVPG